MISLNKNRLLIILIYVVIIRELNEYISMIILYELDNLYWISDVPGVCWFLAWKLEMARRVQIVAKDIAFTFE